MKLPLKAARSIRFQHHATMTACWIWIGATKNGTPRYMHNGVEMTGRQAIWRFIKGGNPRLLMSRCGEPMCVNPHHMEQRKQHDMPKS